MFTPTNNDSLSYVRKITIVGTGNVGTHLFKAFSALPDVMVMTPDNPDGISAMHPGDNPGLDILEVANVSSRSLEGLPAMSDLILIAVKDDAIAEVASRLSGKARIMAHTSGSTPMDILRPYAENFGVFYPLQTFSKEKELIYREIPFFIEGSSEASAERLFKVARLISQHVFDADSDKRKSLHIAAVFACNFANHLVGIADDILGENGMDYRVLLPLIRETVAKLEVLHPHEAQTGPAVRNDSNVISSHQQMLASNPMWSTIYDLLSRSIAKTRLDYTHQSSPASKM